MTREEIKKAAEEFFEWPTEKRETVTLTSCIFFAEHIAEKAVKELENDYRTGKRARP